MDYQAVSTAPFEIGPYDLDDGLLAAARQDGTARVRVYRFPETAVVLGHGSRHEVELNVRRCLADSVMVQRRRGGGCAVVLDPGNVVVSVTLPLPGLAGIHQAYDRVTGWLLEGLARVGIPNVYRDGITDIALGDRKIGGACIFRERGLVYYSTTLLVSPDMEIVERYLQHPPREPEYRRGRSHRDFMTSLDTVLGSVDIEDFRDRLEESLLQQSNMEG